MVMANSQSLKSPIRTSAVLKLAALFLLLAGCAEVTVHRTNSELTADWRNSLMGSSRLSARTMQTLRHFGLDEEYSERPVEAFGRLRSLTIDHPQAEQLFALAEISYDLARKADDNQKQDAVFFYYLSAGFAYRYVTSANLQESGPELTVANSGKQKGTSEKQPAQLPWMTSGDKNKTGMDSAAGSVSLSI